MLNVYKVSGLPKRPKIGTLPENSKYKYWNADTTDYNNTRSFNKILADVNLSMSQISIGSGNLVELYNTVDIDIICLEALEKYKQEPEAYPLDFLGAVIAQMIDDGCFDNDSTDDVVRSNNLDNLIGIFQSKLSEPLNGNFSNSFLEWWNLDVIPNNYNAVTDEQKNRFEQYFANKKTDDKVSGGSPQFLSPSDCESMTDYIVGSGPCLLYIFIPDNEIEQYNRKIRRKRQNELDKLFAYVKNNVGGLYDEESILGLVRIGCNQYWGMTPEAKLKQILNNGGKIGDPASVALIIEIIVGIVSILATLLSIIITVYQLTYSVSVNKDEDVPDDSDISSMLGATDKNSASLSTGAWVAMAALAIGLIIKLKGDNNND